MIGLTRPASVPAAGNDVRAGYSDAILIDDCDRDVRKALAEGKKCRAQNEQAQEKLGHTGARHRSNATHDPYRRATMDLIPPQEPGPAEMIKT